MDPKRHPEGTPTGGRFAPDPHAEDSGVTVADEDFTGFSDDEVSERLHDAIDDAGLPDGVRANAQGRHLEVAARYDSCCDDQENGPHWDHVADDGRIDGGLGGMCGGCGSYGVGWVSTGARPVPEGTDPARHLDALVAEAHNLVTDERAQMDDGTQVDVDDWLARAQWAARDAGYDPEEITPEEWDAVDVDVPLGADFVPGVYVADDDERSGRLVAWSYAARDHSRHPDGDDDFDIIEARPR